MVYVGSFLATAFFLFSLLVLLRVESQRKKGGVGAWVPDHVLVVGILLWVLGMLFDTARRVGDTESMRLFEHVFKLAGNVAIAYSAYGAYQRVSRYSSGGVA